ncbi:MAG: iron-sulfur cluster assembly accessory protein [Actinobacteria bacterium]|jgi:iron-sulfur cluster assembly protein/iron-sulfur cluster insertion protein|nr:iron-sulfur cluster assembly accessory protein [Actinomycetota bacterium]MCL6104977.1 iron-sulfur cluster assembly accessory protein [Actinomycetota bacterium]
MDITTVTTNPVQQGRLDITTAVVPIGRRTTVIALRPGSIDLKPINVELRLSSAALRSAPVVLSDAALNRIAYLIEKELKKNLFLRVGVNPGGCAGYLYELLFDTEVADDDIVNRFGSIKVVVDPVSAELIRGSTIDYAERPQGKGFYFINPNATRGCVCGSSFA